MKKIIFISLILLTSCTFTRQQKAEKLVKDYLNEHLNDPHSYESVSFSQIDTVFKKYQYSDPIGIKESQTCDSLELKKADCEHSMDAELAKPGDEYSDSRYEKFDRESKRLSKQIDKWKDYFKQKNLDYKGPIQSFSIIHTYRAKNGFGALGLSSTLFTIDSAFSKVTDAYDMKNN